MGRAPVYLFAFVCLLVVQASQAQDPTILPTDDPQTVLLSVEIGNNTSACSMAGVPTYCGTSLTYPSGLQTSATNQQSQYMVETTTVDAFPEHISNISLKRLMYQNWNGQLLCVYEPWFDNGGNSHINVGYNEDSQPTVALQNTKMLSRGCNIDFIDFFGQSDSNLQFNLNTTNVVYSDLVGRSGYPLKFAALEDINAFKSLCAGKSQSDTITCIVGDLENDMGYIYNNYILPHSGLYWMDGSPTSMNVVGFFGACKTFTALSCPSDWDTIWSDVDSFVNSPAQSYNMKFVFNFGDFSTPSISQGEYAWPQPYTDATDADSFQDNSASQYNWCDPVIVTCTGFTSGYLDNFYYQGSQPQNQGKLTIGLLYSGFDDSNAAVGWTVGRVIAQQCGQVLLDTANEVTQGGYWGYDGTTNKHQIPYMLMATWNDYEEGTEEESGVDNCYTGLTLGYVNGSTSKMSWTLSNNDNYGYATSKTIHHFVVWTAPSGQNPPTLALGKQLQPSATQYDLKGLTGLTKGATYDVYLEMVGQPSTQNEMSVTPLQYTVPQ